MFVKTVSEVYQYLSSLDKPESAFLLAAGATPIEKLFLQPLVRNINGCDITFLSIRDIVLSEKGTGIFTNILEIMEKKSPHIMVDDIINDRLDNFLERRGYTALNYEQNGVLIRARYIIKESKNAS